MRFGLTNVNSGIAATRDGALAVARLAEDAGFESIWTVEHVVVPMGYASTYPYASSGKMPGGETWAITDPLAWLSFAAAVTERVGLGTAILILPQRNPVVLAKELATLDRLSAGRVLLGIGIGWLREEFEAIGVPFEDRAARTEEYVDAMRVLWRDDEPTFRGPTVSFERAAMFPKPEREIPVIVGGHTEAAARRAGRMGDGFFPWRVTPEQLEPLLRAVEAGAREAGRDPSAVEVTVGGVRDLEAVKAYEDLGVSRFVVPALGRTIDEIRAGVDAFAERFL